jgi:hypothetical protein
MCDFFSISIRTDGAFCHLPTNSHSEAVQASGWRENQANREPFFVDSEWSGEGEYPGANKITRGTPNPAQIKTIDRIYGALTKLISNPEKHAESMLFGAGIFSADQFADVRWIVLNHPDCPKQVASKLVCLKLRACGQSIRSFDPRIRDISGSFDIAEHCNVTAPALKNSGTVDVRAGATFTAPALK